MIKDFAKHLSGVLSGMDYKRGNSVLEAIAGDNAEIVYSGLSDTFDCDGDAFVCEMSLTVSDSELYKRTGSDINMLEEYGVEKIYFGIWINPTVDELKEVLRVYGNGEEVEEELLADEAKSVIEKMMNNQEFDVIYDSFQETANRWVVADAENEEGYADGELF